MPTPFDLTAFPEWKKIVEANPAYRKAWEAGLFPPVSVTSRLTPEAMAARDAKRAAWIKTVKEKVRKRYWGSYGRQPLFGYCLDTCALFNPTTAACMEAGMNCSDRHATWSQRIASGQCPHWEPSNGCACKR